MTTKQLTLPKNTLEAIIRQARQCSYDGYVVLTQPPEGPPAPVGKNLIASRSFDAQAEFTLVPTGRWVAYRLYQELERSGQDPKRIRPFERYATLTEQPLQKKDTRRLMDLSSGLSDDDKLELRAALDLRPFKAPQAFREALQQPSRNPTLALKQAPKNPRPQKKAPVDTMALSAPDGILDQIPDDFQLRFNRIWGQVEQLGNALGWNEESEFCAQFSKCSPYLLSLPTLKALREPELGYARLARPGQMIGLLKASEKVVNAHAGEYRQATTDERGAFNPDMLCYQMRNLQRDITAILPAVQYRPRGHRK